MLYIHHTGCALVQPVCEEKQVPYPANESRSWKDPPNSHPSNPLDSSTPFGSPNESGRAGDHPLTFSDMKCGFYWYKNFLLPKQKNVPVGVLAKHDALLAEFVALCGNKEEQLLELYKVVFS